MNNEQSLSGSYHLPVLLKEVLYYLDVKPGGKYIDGTLGGGGHTRAILEAGGVVLGIDQDQDAIDYVQKNQIPNSHAHLILRRGNFAHLQEIASEARFLQPDGILFDLGVSSHQLETPERGFSFNRPGPLDMRMDQTLPVTAADLINAATEKELANLFWKYGEERASRKIAAAIVAFRRHRKITTADELAGIIVRVRGRTAGDRMHPATRVFQALRIAVNSELDNLQSAIVQAEDLLGKGGRLVVISFHSLEDRIVKNCFQAQRKSWEVITKKPVMASQKEVEINPKARSAKLRAGQKIITP